MPRPPRKAVKGKICRLQLMVPGEVAIRLDKAAESLKKIGVINATRSEVVRRAIYKDLGIKIG